MDIYVITKIPNPNPSRITFFGRRFSRAQKRSPLSNLTWMNPCISNRQFKHGEFADVDPFLCLQSYLNQYFHFFYNFFFFFFFYIQQIKVTTHNKSKRKILTHGQIRTLNQTIQNNRYQPRTPQGTMQYRQSPGPTKNKRTIN